MELVGIVLLWVLGYIVFVLVAGFVAVWFERRRRKKNKGE